ncbi:putative DNA repair exonuclease MRE11/SbcCD-like protein [Bodo saltans virus]|uniref:DNA repair exonuclease MRE11/SbcCD-like protein n=1 Tax=Bodo saltans virus TaxID=2024608 RepID=A0A2H4UT91_9VIRU|nr:putative DNA repair exonuclease MRE11/SbcCD-like protein [Bodo saltans virus]ATZ80094.1 putative DNA repair exonuclease MRE11/SbcCD-like protein [Bodo saltans virus]
MEILEEKCEVERIYHISDIHVMKNSNRDKEYEEVFDELCENLSKKKEKSLIVCTGDIFDNGLSPTSIILVKNLFIKLSKITNVVVIRGNHDGSSRSNSESIDYLFPILYKLKTQNKIYLLTKSGIYQYGNILFGYTDYCDNNVVKIEGKNEGKIKIGLWHGTISGSKTDASEIALDGKFNKDAFNSYDYTLLGDIHKHQYLNNNKTMWYSGSLLQINHGEGIIHGYVELDLKKKKSELVRIKNNYGFVTINIKNNKIEKYDEKNIPKNINLRIIYEKTDESVIYALYEEMKEKYNIMSYNKMKREYYVDNISEKKENECEELKDDESSIKKLLEYIKKNKSEIKEYEIKEMEKILREKIKEINYKYETITRNIKLKNIVFNNFNIYNENNCINFEDFKGVVNLSGVNGSGKSSIIQALIFCLYGKENEQSMTHKYDYINAEKTKMEIMVSASVNDIEYKIYRSCYYKGKKRDTSNIKNNVIIYENGKDISGKNIKEIEKQIIEIFGEQEKFIRLCIMEQKVRKGFMDYTDNEKADFICKILKLDLYNEICTMLDSDILGLKKEIKKNDYVILENGNDVESAIKKRLEEINNENKKIDEEENIKKKEYEILNRKKIEIEIKLKELIEYKSTNKYEKIREELKLKIKKVLLEKIALERKIKEIKEKEVINKSLLSKMDDVEEKNTKFQDEKKKKIKEINKEIDSLMVQIIETPNKYDDIEQIKKDNNDKQKENKEIDDAIKILNTEIEKLKCEIKKYFQDKKNKKNYEKYVDLKEKMDTINNDKQKEIEKKSELIKKKSKKEKEYIMNKKEYDKICVIMHDNKNKLNDKIYENVNEKKNKFDEEKENEIKELNTEIQENLKKYVNENGKIETNKILQKINDMKKELEKHEKELNLNTEKISKYKINIVNFSDKYDSNLNVMYEKYCVLFDELDDKKKILQNMENKYENLVEHFDMIKNHEYNEECAVCMKNKLTIDLLDTQKNIDNYKDEMKKMKKNITATEKNIEKYKKYKVLYEQKQQDKLDNEKLHDNIDKTEKDIEIIIEKKKNIMKDIEEQQKKINDYNNNVIIEEKLKKNKEKLQKLKEKRLDIYDKYAEYMEEIKKSEKSMELLKLKMKEYDGIIQEIDLISDKIDDYEKKYEKTEKIFSEYEIFGELYIKYEENKMNLEKKEKEKEMLSKNYEINVANIGLYHYKIEEYEKYLETEKRNDSIRKKIDEKRCIHAKYNGEKNEEYEKYLRIKDDVKNVQLEMSNTELNFNKICTTEKEIVLLLKENDEHMEKVNLALKLKEEFNDITKLYPNDEISKLQETKTALIKEAVELKLKMENIQKTKVDNKSMQQEYKTKGDLCDMIRNGYVDNLLSNEIIPKFCEGVNEILSSFVNFRIDMEYREKKISLYKKDMNNMCSNAYQLSGYESLMLEISLRMYINKQNKLQKINFFVIDEGFSFCDELSIPKIQYLFEYMRKLYNFTIVVSHNEQIKMYTDMDLPISIQKGKSSVHIVSEKNKEKINECLKIMNNINSNGKNDDDLETVKVIEEKSKVTGEKPKKAKKIIKKVDYKDINKKNKDKDEQIKKGKKMLHQDDSSDESSSE